MFLAVDVGNTQTTIGLFDGAGDVVRQWRMATDSTDTADELHERVYGYFQMRALSLDGVRAGAVASVVPILTNEWRRVLADICGADPLVIDTTRDCGVAVAMPSSVSIGADRLANARAALTTYGAPVIVVDFGTATNIDVVDCSGAFRGGTIMPGILASATALFSRAARLASVPLVVPAASLGSTTETAIQSGIVIGAAAAAEGLVARIVRELAAEWAADNDDVPDHAPRPTVVGTGGFSAMVATATDLFDTIDRDLTIRGIYQIWEHATR